VRSVVGWWQRSTVGLRLVELVVVAAVTAWAWPADAGAAPALLLAAAGLAWLGWLVADPLSLKRDGRLTGRRARAVTLCLAVVGAAAGAATGLTGTGIAFVLPVVAVLAAGRDLPVAGAVVVGAASTAGVEAGLLAGGTTATAAVLGYPAGLLAAGLGGVLRAGRREREAQTRLLLRQSQRTLEEQARGAALAERARIAREVHDVLAHSLGALAIQLEVADALLEAGPVDEAGRVAALQRIRTAHDLARGGIEDTRRAVHALRVDAPPLPDALAVLAASAVEQGRGAPVALDVTGRPRPLAGGELALLRTAQEALVNAAKHAPGAAVRLELDYGEDATTLVVTDDGAQAAADVPRPAGVDGGFGLAGLRERLELAGGSLAAGPHGPGWRVSARLPV